MKTPLRIATRRSPLALWQAGHVKALLERAHPDLEVELVPMTTEGDRRLGTSLAAAGGKGLFVKELERAIEAGRADIAVHSMKDVPVHLPPGFMLGALLEAEDPRDAFVANRYARLADLPTGARVGTASLRRQAQLRALRPDLAVEDLRGNVGTRLKRLDEGRFDAVLLACAGLRRLGLAERIREMLPVETFVPAIGQGVIGIECRADDAETRACLAPLHDAPTALRLSAERAMNARLGGACHVPVAGHAVVRDSGLGTRDSGKTIRLIGLVGAPDGTRLVRDQIEGDARDAADLGYALAERLLTKGGAEILRELGIAV